MLEGALGVQKVGGVLLGDDDARVRLRNVVVPALLGGEPHGVLLGPEMDLGALHVVTARRIANGVVLPAVSPVDNVPI